MLSLAHLHGQAARLAHYLGQTAPALGLATAQNALAYANGFDSWTAMVAACGATLDWSSPSAVLQAARAAGAQRVHLRPGAHGATISFVIDNTPQLQTTLTLMQAHALLLRLGSAFGLKGHGLETSTAPFLDADGKRFDVTCSAQSQTLNFLFVLSDDASASELARPEQFPESAPPSLPPGLPSAWLDALQKPAAAGLYVVASKSAENAAEFLSCTAQAAARAHAVGEVRSWDELPTLGRADVDVLVVYPEVKDLFSMEKIRKLQSLAEKVVLWVGEEDAATACRRLTHRFQSPAEPVKVRLRAVASVQALTACAPHEELSSTVLLSRVLVLAQHADPTRPVWACAHDFSDSAAQWGLRGYRFAPPA